MQTGSGSHWEDKLLLYLYYNKSSYFRDVTINVTKHPYRTVKLLSRLEQAGLIKSEYIPFTLPNGKRMKMLRVITLTEEGKKYVEEVLLPKYKNK